MYSATVLKFLTTAIPTNKQGHHLNSLPPLNYSPSQFPPVLHIPDLLSTLPVVTHSPHLCNQSISNPANVYPPRSWYMRINARFFSIKNLGRGRVQADVS